MILVTGAGGKTGKAVVRALVARGMAVRALVRRTEQAGELIKLGAHDAYVGDMRDPRTWQDSLVQMQSVYHICPNMSPQEIVIGTLILDAAQSASLEHIVYHSVLHPQTQAMPHHWNKLLIEEQILESGIPFTILQPTAYMQNLLAGWPAISEEGVYRVPYAPETRVSLVDLEDVAEVASRVLIDPGHTGAIYELAGPDAPTQASVAATLGEVLCRPVRVETILQDTWERSARASGMGEYQVQTLLAMFRYYEQHGLVGNSRVLSWLLGRPPNGLAEFIRRVASSERRQDG